MQTVLIPKEKSIEELQKEAINLKQKVSFLLDNTATIVWCIDGKIQRINREITTLNNKTSYTVKDMSRWRRFEKQYGIRLYQRKITQRISRGIQNKLNNDIYDMNVNIELRRYNYISEGYKKQEAALQLIAKSMNVNIELYDKYLLEITFKLPLKIYDKATRSTFTLDKPIRIVFDLKRKSWYCVLGIHPHVGGADQGYGNHRSICFGNQDKLFFDLVDKLDLIGLLNLSYVCFIGQINTADSYWNPFLKCNICNCMNQPDREYRTCRHCDNLVCTQCSQYCDQFSLCNECKNTHAEETYKKNCLEYCKYDFHNCRNRYHCSALENGFLGRNFMIRSEIETRYPINNDDDDDEEGDDYNE